MGKVTLKVIPEAVMLPSGYEFDTMLSRRFRLALGCPVSHASNRPYFRGMPLQTKEFIAFNSATPDEFVCGWLQDYGSEFLKNPERRIEFTNGIETPEEFARHVASDPELFRYTWTCPVELFSGGIQPVRFQTEVLRRLSSKTIEELVGRFGPVFMLWMDQQQEFDLLQDPTLDVGPRVYARPDARQQELKYDR